MNSRARLPLSAPSAKSAVKNSELASQPLSLPRGWVVAKIGDVIIKKVAQQEPAGSGTIRYIDIGSIDNLSKRIAEAKRVPAATAPSRARQLVQAGDVLVSMTRPNLNAVAVVPDQLNGATASTGFDVLRSNGLVLTEWLFLLVRSKRFVGSLTLLVQGALYPAVRPSDIRNFEFPLPPLAEQRRIVVRLEALEARSRGARALLAEVPSQLAQARQSLLAAAFKSAVDHHTAEIHPLDSLTQTDRTICYGVVQLGEEIPDGVPCIRTSDLKPLVLLTDSPKRISESVSGNYSRTILRGGEVLVSVRGTLGGIAVAPDSVRGWNISREVAMVALREVALPQFIAKMIAAPQSQSWLTSAIKGVAYSGINIGDLKHLPVPLPPLLAQHEIVRRLEAALARLDAAARAHAAAVAELDRLDQSLLARAFSGTLVPQNPDEIASPVASNTRPAAVPTRHAHKALPYLIRFIPALLRAMGRPMSLERINSAVAFLFLPPDDLLPVVERLSGVEARIHFENFTQPYEDGAFLSAVQTLLRTRTLVSASDRHGQVTLALTDKLPPIPPEIEADARHLAPLVALIPPEAVAPTLHRLQPERVREAALIPA